ncbi:flavodoxin family protein [Porcipelethomonas sp.]|uniref:flavodoxin family protein n=1 Tax=Porcipelethomonas sp. TaxID=2981675 RepID=UPI003EF6A1A8
MKKLVAVLGSTRSGSVSEAAAEQFIKGAEDAGYEAVIFKVNEMNIKGCMGCGSCRKNGTDCIIQDDMQKYYKELHECSALLVTSPNYYANIAGPMITFMNRHYCMNNPDKTSRLQPGIKLAGIFAQGAPENYPDYPEKYDWYLSTFTGKGMELVGKQIIGGDSSREDAMKKAYEMGRSL